MEPISRMAGQLGFVGLGAMGFGMAANLLKAGFQVKGFDVNPKTLDDFGSLSGALSASVQDVAPDQSKVFVMVATPEQVDSLTFGSNGLVRTLPLGGVLCLLSTLPPPYVKAFGAKLEEHRRSDIRLVDCPVSGGVVGARAGSLTIMTGGNAETLDEIEPGLRAMSSPGRLFYCGSLGSASTIKMLNQHLAGTHIVVAAEALSFAKALGLSAREAYRVLMDSEAASWIMGDRGVSMLDADWTPKSAVSIFTKDLGIVNDAAGKLSFPCPIASVALEAFLERAARGYAGDDDASVVCNYEDITQKRVAESSAESVVPFPTSDPDVVETKNVLFVTGKDELCRALRSSSSKTLDAGSTKAEALLNLLSGLVEGSIVCLTGLEDQRHRFATLSAEYPQLQFLDCQVIGSEDCKSTQVLFSAERQEMVSAVALALPPDVKAVPVKGYFGAASAMFLVSRLASIIHLAAAAECLSLAVASGVPTELVYRLIAGAAGSSAQFNHYFPRMEQQNFSCDAKNTETFENALKDLSSIRAATTELKFPGRLLEATYQIFKSVSLSLAEKSCSAAAVAQFWRRSDWTTKVVAKEEGTVARL